MSDYQIVADYYWLLFLRHTNKLGRPYATEEAFWDFFYNELSRGDYEVAKGMWEAAIHQTHNHDWKVVYHKEARWVADERRMPETMFMCHCGEEKVYGGKK